MNGNFNQAGERYESLAVAGPAGHYKMLAHAGCHFFDDLQKHLCAKWSTDPQSSELKRWSASMECLQSFLYQTTRMAHHSKDLCSLAPPPDHSLGHAGIEALTDFETLLYLGRAALDRLTFAIAKQTYRQECEKFDKLANILGNYVQKDERAKHALTVIEVSLDAFHGVLIDEKNGKTGLRSLLAHSRSTGESITNVFTVHSGPNGEFLRFDLELEGKGILHTSWALNQMISFVALNLIALYSDFKRSLKLEDCKPTWVPQCVRLSSFIDETKQGPILSTFHTSACGFKTLNHHVRRDIFKHAQRT